MSGTDIDDPKAAIRVLLVDDHPIVREGLALFLGQQKGLQAFSHAADADEAMSAMARCAHHLAVVDISLEHHSGLDLIQSLRLKYPALPILAMSMHEESLFAERAVRAGANGYLMKRDATRSILQAIQQVLDGNIYLSPAMHTALAHRLRSSRNGEIIAGAVDSLTPREFEVLHLLALGLGTREIAGKLNRSVKTIEAHRASLKEKLQLPSGKALERFAAQWLDRA